MNTQRLAVLIILFLLPSIGCSIGSVVVDVEEGGSGGMEFSTLKLGDAGNVPDIEGTSPDRSSSYTLERNSYTFDDISSVSFNRLNFDRTVENGKARIHVTVPVHREAKWVQQLDVTEQRINELQEQLKNISDRLSERDTPVDVEPADALKLKFEMNVPEEIEDYEVDAPDLDDHEWVSERNTKNRSARDNQLVIDIPVRAIFHEDVKTLSLRLTYPASESAGEGDGEKDVQTY